MTKRNTIYLVLQFALYGALYALVSRWKPLAAGREPPDIALAALPEDSFLVATLDVAQIRASVLAAPLLALGGSAVNEARARCGFDPQEKIQKIALAVSEDGTPATRRGQEQDATESSDFGVSLEASISRAELVECAKKVLAAERESAVSVTTEGDFSFIEDPRSGAKLAFHEGGPFLLGRGAWLAAMVDTIEKRRKSVRDSVTHTELRRALDGTAPHAVVVTALLPAKLRDRLKREMDSESAANATMKGVLGVRAAGLALTPGAAGGTAEVVAELRCDTADACEEVRKLIERKRNAWSKDLTLRLVGIGPLVDALDVQAHDGALRATTHLPSDDVRRLVERLLEMRSGRATPAPATRPWSKPDEVVPARREDAGTRAP